MKLVIGITIILLGQITMGQPAGCLAPIEAPSTMFPNPTEVNGVFSFDYEINSWVNGVWADDESSVLNNYGPWFLKYHVNTADGSIYMTQGFVNVLLTTLGVSLSDLIYHRMGKIEGIIRLANGQLVIYVIDRQNLMKRAITVDNATSPMQLAINQRSKLSRYIEEVISTNSIQRNSRNSEASDLIMKEEYWGSKGGLTQVKGPWERGPDNITYRVSMQIANRPGIEPIATNIPLVGLLTGVMKSERSPCNYLVVETTIEQTQKDFRIGDPAFDEPARVPFESSDARVTETMTRIVKTHKTVDTMEYEIMRLEGGFNLTEVEREKILASQDDYYADLETLLKQLEKCRDDEHCLARVNQDILELQKKFENQAYNAASKETITDVQLNEQVVKDRMYTVHSQIIEQEKKCKILNDQTARCGGCMDRPYDDCLKKLQELNDFLDELECQLAKLKGMADLMEDCH